MVLMLWPLECKASSDLVSAEDAIVKHRERRERVQGESWMQSENVTIMVQV